MNILLIGSGGREHALANKISQSDQCSALHILPGNPGTAHHGINVAGDPSDFQYVANVCREKKIDMIVVGPEEFLVKGMRDYFAALSDLNHILFVGPGQQGAQLEGSKDFSKAFMKKHGVPTAAYATFDEKTLPAGIAYVKQHTLPVVLKADGLAAGKGVLICQTHEEAEAELKLMIADGKFGAAGSRVVVEEFLDGIELSVFVLSDGTNYKVLPSAKDYKRIGEGDTGLNTGGMGAVSPVPFADEVFMKKVEKSIIIPTVNGLKEDGIPYVGFIFIGLMNVNGQPKVIEYNCRMGDPETEVVFPLITSDVVGLFKACANGQLKDYSLAVDSRAAATVVMVSAGYPGAYEKGKPIAGTDNASDSIVFHSGTREVNGELVTNGGRVLAITSFGANVGEAVKTSLKNAAQIEFEGSYFRKDIGYEFL